MPRQKLEYSEEQLKRPTNFIVVLADRVLDVSSIDIKQAEDYVAKHNRRAIVITTNKSFSDIDKVSYRNIMNAVKPVFRRVDTHDDEYFKVYQKLTKIYKNGLLIAYRETITNGIAQMLAETEDIGLDIVMQRESALILTKPEIQRVNFFRIHKNDNFRFCAEVMKILNSMYGEAAAMGISLAQFISNCQYDIFGKYFNEMSLEIAREGLTNFINNDEYVHQLAYHVYYDMVNDRIIGLEREKCIPYIAGLLDALGTEWTEDNLREFRDQYFGKQNEEAE